MYRRPGQPSCHSGTLGRLSAWDQCTLHRSRHGKFPPGDAVADPAHASTALAVSAIAEAARRALARARRAGQRRERQHVTAAWRRRSRPARLCARGAGVVGPASSRRLRGRRRRRRRRPAFDTSFRRTAACIISAAAAAAAAAGVRSQSASGKASIPSVLLPPPAVALSPRLCTRGYRRGGRLGRPLAAAATASAAAARLPVAAALLLIAPPTPTASPCTRGPDCGRGAAPAPSRGGAVAAMPAAGYRGGGRA